VTEIEETGAGANDAVLLQDARVLYRHRPASERNHPRAEIDMAIEQGSLFQWGVLIGQCRRLCSTVARRRHRVFTVLPLNSRDCRGGRIAPSTGL